MTLCFRYMVPNYQFTIWVNFQIIPSWNFENSNFDQISKLTWNESIKVGLKTGLYNLTLSNVKPTFAVPSKYLIIYCINVLFMTRNIFTQTLIACEMLGRVKTIAYIILFKLLEYGTLDICSISSSVF